MRDEKRSTGFEDEIIGVKGPGYSQGACQGNPEANRDAEEFQAGELGHQGRCFILETPTAPAGSVYRRTPPSRLGRALRSSTFKYDLVEMVTYFCKKRKDGSVSESLVMRQTTGAQRRKGVSDREKERDQQATTGSPVPQLWHGRVPGGKSISISLQVLGRDHPLPSPPTPHFGRQI